MELATGKLYACKVISKHKLKSKEEIEDVRREVAIMHHLAGHENIVTVTGAYEDARAVYLVMEYGGGGELFNRSVEAGHYSERKAAGLFRTMLRVLHHCHTMGVVHRDLKPENFLLSAAGDAGILKATDFGLSMFVKPGQVLDEMVGSPYYVAPEVLKRKYGVECDVWSAGVILYILLCGLPPFWGDNEKAIFESIMVGHLDFSEAPWPSISAPAKELIKQLLTKDVKARLTIEQALAHPWVMEGGSAPDDAMDSEVLKRMRTFANQSKFKQLVRPFAMRCLRPRAAFLPAFHRAGHDHAGEALEKGGAGGAAPAVHRDGRGQVGHHHHRRAAHGAGQARRAPGQERGGGADEQPRPGGHARVDLH